MSIFKTSRWKLICLILWLCQLDLSVVVVQGQHLACDNRKPEGHTPTKRDGDGGFRIVLVGPHANRGLYSPNEVYTVTIQGLKTRYSTQKFTEFLLVAESEKQAMMGPSGMVTTGIFHIIDDTHTRFGDTCPDGVTSVNRQPKAEISVLWTAPSVLVASCITFKATLVERPHVWYIDDGQLTKTVCPETNQKQMPALPPVTVIPKVRHLQNHGLHINSHQIQIPPVDRRESEIRSSGPAPTQIPPVAPTLESHECCACDEAKYEIIFEGIWSKETHPKDFPENEWLLHFSDIIGASHSPDYHVWKTGEVASEGIRQVAEWGATRHLENELKAKSRHINTIIKARGLWHPNERGKTSAAFRVDKNHHLMSLVSMIGPSPDWIVGISGLELCLKNCTWLENTQLDLFPYDAGTDTGITYMSPNTPTEPRGKIEALTGKYPDDTRSPFYDPKGKNPMQPFATVHIRRQRIYPKNCNDTSRTSDTSHEVYLSENTEDVDRPECAVLEWTSWSSCSVTCGKGLRMRKRNYALPIKADMMRCDRQLIEKEMCLGDLPTCSSELNEGNVIEELDDYCAVTPWSDWKPCSVACGEGTRSRHRRYKNHLGRKKCNMDMIQTETCQGLQTDCDPGSNTGLADHDCPLTPWSEWAPCSVSCGIGFQIRSRGFLVQNDDPLPKKCDRIQLSQRSECVGEYGKECKITTQEAKKICVLPSETGPCRASKTRYHFNTDKGMCVPFIYGGCKGNRNRFDTEQECNQVCGFMTPASTQTTPTLVENIERYLPTSTPLTARVITERSTTPKMVRFELKTTDTSPISVAESDEVFNLDLGASNSIRDEDIYSSTTNLKWTTEATSVFNPEPSIYTENRMTQNLAEPLVQEKFPESLIDRPVIDDWEVDAPPPVDCEVSGWSQWSSCSESCGTGYMVKTREILVEPQNEGRRCPRRLSKRKPCRLPAC